MSLLIPVNEIRVGNWFNAIFIGNFQVSQADFAEWGAIPANGIELTPEILQACGFTQMKDKFNEPYLGLAIYNGIDGANLRFYDNETKSVGLFSRDNMIGYNQYFLHQVQNLYFALTGEELRVNLQQEKAPM